MTSEDLELRVLQAARLKGRITPDALTDNADADAVSGARRGLRVRGVGLAAQGRSTEPSR